MNLTLGKFRMKSHSSRNSGFTLVELMVAMVAGLIVSAAALAFFFASMKSNGEYVQSTRLTQELRNTLDLMSRDLRRAGYDDDGLKYVGNVNVSPFTPMCITASGAATTCLAAASSGDCVVYAYDRTHPNGNSSASGTAGALDLSNGEVRALRLRTRTVGSQGAVGVIEYAQSFGTTRPTCAGAGPAYSTTVSYPGCNNATGWCPLSDPTRIDVTGLTITNNSQTLGADPTAQVVRQLGITIVGRLTGTTNFTRSEQTTVKVRSDCLRAAITNCTASP